MTITRRWQAGGEVDGADSASIEFPDGPVYLVTSTAGEGKTGGFGYRSGQNDAHRAYKAIPATRQLRMGFHFRGIDVGFETDGRYFAFLDAGGSELGYLGAYSNFPGFVVSLGGNSDSDPALWATQQWHHVGIDLKVDSSAGWIKVYIDGVEVLSATGNTGNTDIEKVAVGKNAARHSGEFYFDDLYVDDTTGEGAAAVLPDLRFEYITPNGDGNYSQLDGSDGNQVDNYLQADERPHDSDTTYNEAQAAEEKDSYALTTIALETGETVEAVIPCAIARKTDGGVASKFALMLRENSVDWEGAAQDLGTSYGLIFERRATDPGGAPWDQDSLDAVEAGVWAEGTF